MLLCVNTVLQNGNIAEHRKEKEEKQLLLSETYISVSQADNAHYIHI